MAMQRRGGGEAPAVNHSTEESTAEPVWNHTAWDFQNKALMWQNKGFKREQFMHILEKLAYVVPFSHSTHGLQKEPIIASTCFG